MKLRKFNESDNQLVISDEMKNNIDILFSEAKDSECWGIKRFYKYIIQNYADSRETTKEKFLEHINSVFSGDYYKLSSRTSTYYRNLEKVLQNVILCIEEYNNLSDLRLVLNDKINIDALGDISDENKGLDFNLNIFNISIYSDSEQESLLHLTDLMTFAKRTKYKLSDFRYDDPGTNWANHRSMITITK